MDLGITEKELFNRYLNEPVETDLEKKREIVFENAVNLLGDDAVNILSELQYAAMEAAFHAGLATAADLIMQGVA